MSRKLSVQESLGVLTELCVGLGNMGEGLRKDTHEMKCGKDGIITLTPKDNTNRSSVSVNRRR